MVCIIDDREDVWNFAPNLVHVKPYIFFKNTGDINAPPGSSKVPTKQPKSTSKGKRFFKWHKDPLLTRFLLAPEPQKATKEKPVAERRDSIDMPTFDDASPSKSKDVDATSAVSDDLELSEDSNGSTSSSSSSTSTEEVKKKPEDTKSKETDSDSSEKSGMDDDLSSKDDKVEDDLIELEDTDDYLLYLEDTLKSIHANYYKVYDELQAAKSSKVPDLKQIIPSVKRKALRGTTLVFSGVVPNHVKLEASKPFLVARSLGARVSDKVDETTSHLVAARVGTVKVNEAKKRASSIHLVTPDWLWNCAERWERVDERLYPLCKSAPVTINPPAHCSSPEDNALDRIPDIDIATKPSPQRQISQESLPETLNPFLAFSSEDLKGMDKEVEDILSNEDSTSSDDDSDDSSSSDVKTPPNESSVPAEPAEPVAGPDLSESSSSDESMTGELPRGMKRKFADGNGDDDPLERFKRGEVVDDCGFDIAAQSDDEDGDEDRSMAAQLEREFLGDSNSNF